MNLLMISGDRALAQGKKGAFYNTIDELHKHFEKIDIICPKVHSSQFTVQSSKNNELRTTNPFNNVKVHPSPWPLIFQPIWILKEGIKILKTNNYELESMNYLMTVHEYPPFYNGIGAWLLWRKTKIPYVLEIFHIPGYPKAATMKEWIYKLLMSAFIKIDASRASVIRVMNRGVGNFIEARGIKREKIRIIPAIYLDGEIFKPLNIKKEYDLIFVGRLESNKGINLFLDSVKLLVANYRLSFKCLIVGEGSLRGWLKLQITNYRLPITLFGFAKDHREVAELINKSKILVMPSYNEGGPRVVVEALACGVPVLAAPVGIVPDLLKNDRGGEIIAWEAQDIAHKITGLLNDPGRYQKYSQSGIELSKRFDKKEAIKYYAEEIQKVRGS